MLIADLRGSVEAADAYTVVNCGGLGRIRIYRQYRMHLATHDDQPPKPLYRSVSGSPSQLRTQVFQLAACNWRCWFCYVDDRLLAGDVRSGQMVSAGELLDLMAREDAPPEIIELSGGQADLVPEWALWVMEEVNRRGLAGKMHVWVDDNLSSDYLWRYLTRDQIAFMASFPGHTRVGCFKGIDEESFTFNTRQPAKLFDRQFEIMKRMLDTGFDMYAYAVLTDATGEMLNQRMYQFILRLQAIHPMLPLRTIPLKIRSFGCTAIRSNEMRVASLAIQEQCFSAWQAQLMKLYEPEMLSAPYESIKLR